MNINDFRNFVLFLIRKSQSGSNPTPAQFNLAVERAFIGWVMEQYGNPHTYQPGMPIPPISWQITTTVTDNIRFLLEKRLIPVDAEGKMIIPNGTFNDLNGNLCNKYMHLSSVRSYYIKNINGTNIKREVPVAPMRDHEIGEFLSSTIDMPTLRYPRFAFYNNYIQFYPENISRVVFTYLRLPNIPKWGFTTVNNRPVYDPLTSVDIESPDTTINEIAARTLSYLGISIRLPEIVDYAEKMKQTD